ncbi:MAG: methyltransferase domain-containing protein [Candidatus Delongbacteria bacterium]|jgi:SAM-dependent methyltransferase|nr:methyltransferase domain-containing protein [Candidatus Delongbacteria bacterium]
MNNMNTQLEYWDNLFSKLGLKEPSHDGWLIKHNEILQLSENTPIVDLGCGSGHNSKFLKENGYDVISCDFSSKALNRLQTFVPDCKPFKFNMLDGFPFDDNSFKILISDLSIQYFTVEDTFYVLSEIKRVLHDDGYFICRVNSTNDTNYGAGKGIKLSENYYNLNGKLKRFFNREDLNKFFSDWKVEHIEECEMNRYEKTKILWEIVAKK